MPKKLTPGVYGVLRLCNRKSYIGSSENVERRIAEHRAQLPAPKGGKWRLAQVQRGICRISYIH